MDGDCYGIFFFRSIYIDMLSDYNIKISVESCYIKIYK